MLLYDSTEMNMSERMKERSERELKTLLPTPYSREGVLSGRQVVGAWGSSRGAGGAARVEGASGLPDQTWNKPALYQEHGNEVP